MKSRLILLALLVSLFPACANTPTRSTSTQLPAMNTARSSCAAPVATTGGVTDVSASSATISGSYTGPPPTRAWFDFGEDYHVTSSVVDQNGVGKATQLQPGRTYYYQYSVQNECGTTLGGVRFFTTPK